MQQHESQMAMQFEKPVQFGCISAIVFQRLVILLMVHFTNAMLSHTTRIIRFHMQRSPFTSTNNTFDVRFRYKIVVRSQRTLRNMECKLIHLVHVSYEVQCSTVQRMIQVKYVRNSAALQSIKMLQLSN